MNPSADRRLLKSKLCMNEIAMTKKSQIEMNISSGYSIRPSKIKLYTYELFLFDLELINFGLI